MYGAHGAVRIYLRPDEGGLSISRALVASWLTAAGSEERVMGK
jgi:hypothetical protein